MGDFRDLRELIALAAPLGCGIVGLNPLHALMPANPAHISPYSPSSRQFLNVLYIAVEDVPDFAECDAGAASASRPPSFRRCCSELRATTNVDYVARRGREVRSPAAAVRAASAAIIWTQARARAQAFRSFVEDAGRTAAAARDLRCARCAPAPARAAVLGLAELAGGISRSDVAGRESLRARARRRTSNTSCTCNGSPKSSCARRRQLARERGMSIGLYGDVAVGANSGGSETWSNRHLYLQGASVGAPPDALALKGQDWGIPPQDPNELRAQQYRAVHRSDPQQHAARRGAAARSRDDAVSACGGCRAACSRRTARTCTIRSRT